MEAYRCPNCGEALNINGDVLECVYCRSRFNRDDGKKMMHMLKGVLDEAKVERLSTCKRHLWDVAHEEYPSKEKVCDAAKAVLSFNDEDFIANVYLHSHSRDPLKVNLLLAKSEVTPPEAAEAFRWLLPSLSPRMVGPLHDFIDRHFSNEDRLEKINKLEEEAEKLANGIYEPSLPREVFLCYSSADMPKVIQVMDTLEQNDISCFAAFRNLRHGKGAQENYLSTIKEAMRSCQVLVFLSSNASRSMSCDAMRVELPYLIAEMPGKPRVEYLLEDYEDTPYLVRKTLKKAFPEQEYCTDVEDLMDRIMSAIEEASSGMSAKEAEYKKLLEEEKERHRQELELAKKEAELEKKTKEAELERLKKEADAAREQAALERQRIEQEAERKREEEKKRLLAELEAARKVAEEQPKKPKEPETKPLKEETTINDAPRFDGTFVYYGRYPQSEVTDKETLNALKGKPINNNGWLSYNGNEYAEASGKFFLVEPIKWRILKKENGEAYLLSDVLLDRSGFDHSTNVFSSSEVHGWLNGEFKNEAFSNDASRLIPIDGDMVSLPSKEDIQNVSFGFASDNDRLCKPTPYAKARGAYADNKNGCGFYWAKTPYPSKADCVGEVNFYGNVTWCNVASHSGSVRPVIRIKLSGQSEKAPVKKQESKQEYPRFDGDFAFYGKYPQSEVTDKETLNALKGKPTNNNGWLFHNSNEYAEVKGKYFLVEPIKWRVLKKDGGESYLLSDVLLDAHRFDGFSNVFSSSEIRGWLNGEFKQAAFKEGGSSILALDGDAISLPSESDMQNASYGFGSYDDRLCKATPYAKARGSYAWDKDSPSWYWTKTPQPSSSHEARQVNDNGYVGNADVSHVSGSVRPAIRIKLAEQSEKAPVKKQEYPRFDGDFAIYGKYPQSEVTDKETLNALKGKPTNNNGWISHNGNEYAEVKGKYFLVEPIKWRVLKKDDGKAKLISEVLLDAHRFDPTGIEFASSEIRGWLNGEFKNAAFPDGGASIIKLDGDALSLPREEEFNIGVYGFKTKADWLCKPTPYAMARGSWWLKQTGSGMYWTQTNKSTVPGYVRAFDGQAAFFWDHVEDKRASVRPILWVKVD